MKQLKRILPLSALLLALTGGVSAQAQSVPPLINFQGRLAKPDGTPLPDGPYSVTFSLWNAASGGTQVWTETDGVTARNGAFAVLLGKNTALTDSLFNAPVYLQIQIGTGTTPLTPRQQLVTVAHAFKADIVPDNSITSAKIAPGAVGPNQLASLNGYSWLLGGNSGTTGTQFLGTTDNQPLIFKTGGAERMRVTGGGFVGIGRSGQVSGAEYFGLLAPVTSGYGGMYIQTTGATGLPFYGYAAGGSATAWTYLDGGDGNKWKVYNGGDVITALPGGGVGIGTTAPADGLSVVGGIHVDFNDQFGVSNGRSSLLFGGPSTGEGIGSDRSPTSATRYGLQFHTSGTLKMALTNSGNLGVGVANPAQRLEVNGNILSTGADFILKGRGGGFGNAGNAARALVDGGAAATGFYGGGLIINFENDYGRTLIQSPLDVSGSLKVTAGGVYATAANSGGQLATSDYGVYGTSAASYGIRGEISGAAHTNGYFGVAGKDTVSNNLGLLGGPFSGVVGQNYVNLGKGVFGVTTVAGGYGVYGDANGTTAYAVYGNGKAGGTTSWASVSDSRYKRNVTTLDNALNSVLALRGVSYDWDRAKWPGKNFSEGRQIGFIAQEVEKIFPELVQTDNDGYKSVMYANAVPILVEAIKAQQKQIDDLKTQIKQRDGQQKELDELKRQVAALVEAMKTAAKPDAPQR